MMRTKLSVLVPGIRTENWRKLYDSLTWATSVPWEIIFISPYELPAIFKRKTNVKWIQDWGSPIRCQQIGLNEAEGEFITWAADDGEFLENSLDIGFDLLDFKKNTGPTLIMGKYYEGAYNPVMEGDAYYDLSKHDASSMKYIADKTFMLNVGIVPKNLLIDIGGWDCQFEVCPMAYNDLAIRLQRTGVKFIIQNEMMFSCSHMPGHEGDHGPVHDGQVDHDQPLFNEIYSDILSTSRTTIPLDNWEQSPKKWERRFGK